MKIDFFQNSTHPFDQIQQTEKQGNTMNFTANKQLIMLRHHIEEYNHP